MDHNVQKLEDRSSYKYNAPHYIASYDTDTSDDDDHVEGVYKSIDMLFEVNHMEILEAILMSESQNDNMGEFDRSNGAYGLMKPLNQTGKDGDEDSVRANCN